MHAVLSSSAAAVAALVIVSIVSACAGPGAARRDAAPPNTLTEAERADGWELLFDGRTFDGWRGLGQDGAPTQVWRIENGHLHKIGEEDVARAADGQPVAGGDLITIDTFEDFEFAFEWRISRAGNSGVKYNVSEELSISDPPATAALGFEYQVIDDEGHPDILNGPTRSAAALYDLVAPAADKPLRPAGQYNQSRIVLDGSRGEHWLNGERVLTFDLSSPEFADRLAASKYRDKPGFADRRSGHIVLQDHGDAVWYRNLKIRRLNRP